MGRFFQLNDLSDERHCLVVAEDLDHARQVVRDAAMEFNGEYHYRLDEAEARGIVVWKELVGEDAARNSVRTSLSAHGQIAWPLVQLELREWFSTID